VAIASYTGHNQEDSIVLNKSSVSRGLFRAMSLKKYGDQIEPNQSTALHDIFTKPDREKAFGMRSFNYDKLNQQGYVPEETVIKNGDAIIGKLTPVETGKYKDNTTFYKANIDGTIDKTYTKLKNQDGYEMIRIRIRQTRTPQIGDKLSSRHGQKGTCGLQLSQGDMPMTENGISPDIIINPNCMPKRMTIGQLIEIITGKVAALSGEECDATPFNFTNLKLAEDALEALGYNRFGEETLYNGMTGEPMESTIFIGPCYYQRLKHMVADKIHARSTGPKQILVRQPPEGPSQEMTGA